MWRSRSVAAHHYHRKPSTFRPKLEALETRVALTKLPKGFVETPIATGINVPTAMAIAPDGRVFVCEQTGAIRVIENDILLPDPFTTITVDFGPTPDSERGLLGIAFDPDFANNNYVYVYYTNPDDQFTSHNRVSRFVADGNVADMIGETVIFDAIPTSFTAYHNGGAIHFGEDGKLYIGVGEDYATPDLAQSLNSLRGKMLRINSDGTIPDDNPFFNDPEVLGDNKAIWAYGLRNPFTFAVHPGDGTIYINDVGDGDGFVPKPFEEINEGVAGANYGWPTEQGNNVDPAFADPLFAYKHGPGLKKGFAIVGGAFYVTDSQQFPDKFVGDYFFADFVNRWIRAYDVATDKAKKFAKETPQLMVGLELAPDGSLLYLARGLGADTGVVNRIGMPDVGPVSRSAKPMPENHAAMATVLTEKLGLSSAPTAHGNWAEIKALDTVNPTTAAVRPNGSSTSAVTGWNGTASHPLHQDDSVTVVEDSDDLLEVL